MKKQRPRFLVLKLVLSLGVALIFAEVALHLFPVLVPRAYRASFPLHGVGFFEPELLDETAIEDMPLPLYIESTRGPVPADLVELGLAPLSAQKEDRERWGDVLIECDAVGLPNPTLLAQADVVLVGDSFAVSAGVREPVGLVARLEEATGLSVYNLGVAGIGPFQERHLLLSQGLPKRPRLVIWMFFGGNDLTDTLVTLFHRHQGHHTWGDVHADSRPPTLRLPAILRYLRGRRIDAQRTQPLPGLKLNVVGDGNAPGESPVEEVWMHPNYLQALTRTRAAWQADPAWAATLEVLDEVTERVSEAGAEFLFVYLPSKAQVLLPLVEPDAARIHAMATFGQPEPSLTPEEFLSQALAHGSALEDLLRATCEERGIPYLSATGLLRAGARRGEVGYLVADTHWDPTGHGQLLGALVEAVQDLLD